MSKQERRALKGTDPWCVGHKGFGKVAKSRGNRRAGKAAARAWQDEMAADKNQKPVPKGGIMFGMTMVLKIEEARRRGDAIAATVKNPFGKILVFTDRGARDAYSEHVKPFRLTGEEAVQNEHCDGSTVVAWGQV